LALNWVPSYAAFGSPQADIFVGINSEVDLIAADDCKLNFTYKFR